MDKKTQKALEKQDEEEKELQSPLPNLSEIAQKNPEIPSVESKDVLLMRVVTWLRDSHALFDYESRQIQKKNMKVDHSGKFIRDKDEVKTVALAYKPEKEDESTHLFSLIKDEQGDYFIDTEKVNTTDKLWLVVRAMKNDTKKLSYELQKGDIIKLGRIQFRVKDLQTPTIPKNDPKTLLSNQDILEVRSIIYDSKETTESDDGSTPQCRFCWGTGACEEDPLINVGDGTGTMKYIHLQCLKRWVKSKVKPLTNEKMKDGLESFIWKTFECEVCKIKYPYTLRHVDQCFNIFDINIPQDDPFGILESLSMEKNSSRMIYIMKPNSPTMEFKVGRGHDSDLRISDISVSRFHAKIKYEEGKFMLEDNTSKFGTLVQIKGRTPITKNHTSAVQSGRTVVTYHRWAKDFPPRVPEKPK